MEEPPVLVETGMLWPLSISAALRVDFGPVEWICLRDSLSVIRHRLPPGRPSWALEGALGPGEEAEDEGTQERGQVPDQERVCCPCCRPVQASARGQEEPHIRGLSDLMEVEGRPPSLAAAKRVFENIIWRGRRRQDMRDGI